MYSTLASVGGSIVDATIQGDNYSLTVHLPPNADITRFTEAVMTHHPRVELATRRQVNRSTGTEGSIAAVTDSLTDQQQTVLRAAHHSGMFEWPRDSSGDQVASSLDIAASTFHYHLRKAEQKIVKAALSHRDTPD